MELLVVVAIVALLVVALLPSLSRVRAMTRLTLCKTQLNGQITAHFMYGAHNDDHKPALTRQGRYGLKVDWVSPDVKWMDTPVGQGILVVGKYLQFEQLLCPSASMQRDAALDRIAWAEARNAGSSFAYFWRHPGDVTDPKDPARGATYGNERRAGRMALLMDINCQEGHAYQGDYADRAWPSHPVMEKVNVAFVDGSVDDGDSAELILDFPGGQFEELAWFDKAHKRR